MEKLYIDVGYEIGEFVGYTGDNIRFNTKFKYCMCHFCLKNRNSIFQNFIGNLILDIETDFTEAINDNNRHRRFT